MKTKTRLSALGATTGLLLATLTAVAAPAQAAWSTQHTFHGAKIQVCKTGNGQRVRLRIDNRNGNHAHTASVDRGRNGNYAGVQVRAAAGSMSGTKVLAVRPGDDLSWGAGEGDGIRFGDVLILRQLRVC